MSALTFEILSAELTQALSERSITPPKTVARCTLGRDKVMVLVEYPLESAEAESFGPQTLDWLEEHLRSRFDTTGLPDEVADLSDAAAEVSVQLYLKHLSEAKPFTMRSFTWKVDDGFDELFGAADISSAINGAGGSAELGTGIDEGLTDGANQNASVTAVKDADAGFFSVSPLSGSNVPLPEGEEERVLLELEENSLALDLDADLELDDVPAPVPNADSELDLGSEFGLGQTAVADSDTDLAADFGLDMNAESSLDPSSPVVPSSDLPSDLAASLGLSPSTDFVPDLSVNSGEALDADLSVGVDFTDTSDYPSTDFTLPGEAPAFEPSDLDLPTVDLPIVTPAVGGSSDFFSLTEEPDFAEAVDNVGSGLEVENLLDGALLDEKRLDETVLDSAGLEAEPTLESDVSLPSASVTTQAEGLEAKPAESSEDLFDLLSSEAAIANNTSLVSDALSADEAVVDAGEGSTGEQYLTDPELTGPELAEENLAEEEDSEEEDPEEFAVASFTDELSLREIAAAQRAEAEMEAEALAAQAETTEALAADDLVPDDLGAFSLDASQIAELATANAVQTAEPELPDVPLAVEADDSEPSDALADATDDNSELGSEPASALISEQASDLSDVADLPDSEVLESHDLERYELVDSDLAPVDDASVDDAPVDDDAEAAGVSAPLAVGVQTADEDHEVADEGGTSALDEYEYEEVLHDAEAYADDPVYYLEEESTYSESDYVEEDYEEVVASVDETEVQRQRELWQKQTKTGNPMVLVGAIGFLFAGLVGFLLTRPCTVGRCDRIEAAQVKGEDALDNLRVDGSLDAVTASKKELKESILLLDPIPPWSGHYDDAQAILPEYERQLSALDLVTTAQGKAYSAAVQSQNPPHSVARWQEIATKWREATQALSGVPEDSPVRELANRKLVEYRANLSTILVRIEAESGAEVSLRQAQQASARATQQTPSADSSEAWESVLSDWESAVENLRRIPQGTSAFAEAQQILPEYEATLQDVRTRAEQERGASRLLFRAQQLGNDAQQAESGEEWTTAVERWSLAVIQLKDIPEGTFARSTAQSLLTTYTGALAAAENNMQVFLRFQPVEPSFYLVCGEGTGQKCSYSVAAGKVRMDLVQGYDSVIEESITPPPQRSGIEVDTQLVNQSNRLLQQITLLSTQAQIPVELYDSEGAFLARYQPDLDGFVRQ